MLGDHLMVADGLPKYLLARPHRCHSPAPFVLLKIYQAPMLGEIIFLLLEFTILQIVQIDHRFITYIYIQYIYIYSICIYIYIYYMLCICYVLYILSVDLWIWLVLSLWSQHFHWTMSGLGAVGGLSYLSVGALGWWLRRIVGQTINFLPQSSVKTMFFWCFLQVSNYMGH